jgi:tripartite-type tricarboxylate transporter receptor subunit TctC
MRDKNPLHPLHPSRRTLLQAAALATLALSHAARSQPNWPSRTVKVVVPFPPGGTTDYVTRIVTSEIGKTLGQTVFIENKPGAGTVIGVDAVAKSAPDGYSLVCVAGSFCANATLVKKLPYDSFRDLRPVALMGVSEHALVAHPSTGLKTVAELNTRARAKPGTVSYASFGNGTAPHLSGEMLKAQMGIDILHVPYKGQGPALTDLLGGQVDLMFGSWLEVRDHVRAGKLNVLGMATKKRSEFAPEVPTLAEQGVPIESNTWAGLLAPAATPDAVVARLNTEINKALALPSVVAAFKKNSVEPLPGSIDQFRDYMRAETARFEKIIRQANITTEV